MLEYDSAQRRSPQIEELLDLVRYRNLLSQLIARNIKVRYKRSVLGLAWTMLHPLMTMTILVLVFQNLLKTTIEHYAVYVLSALVLWTFFAQTSSWILSEIVWGGSLLARIHVPPTVFAASALGTGLVNLVLSLVPLAVIMVATDVAFSPALLFLPVPIVLVALFTLGIGLVLSRLAVLFGDVVYMYEILLSAWYFLTPLLYPLAIIPEESRFLFYLNPMYYLIEMFRIPVLEGHLPDATTVGIGTISAFVTLGLGWWYFTRNADEFAYRV